MIDANNIRAWPPEIAPAVGHFKQGDLIECPPFFYVAAPRYGIWQFTRDEGDQSESEQLFDIADGAPYGMITSQTCDIDEQSQHPKKPWVQVAPVIDVAGVLSGQQQNQTANHEVQHLVLLDAPQLPSGFWVADLRIECPMEKSCLVGRTPIAGFADESGFLRLAERLARQRNRPALSNPISETIVGKLRGALRGLSKRNRTDLLTRIEELRLLVTGTRLDAKAARLIVITKDATHPPAVTTWFNEWWDDATAECREAGINLLGNKYTDLKALSAAEYKASIELDFASLSPDD